MNGVADSLYNRDILRLAASIPFQRRLDRPMATAERSSPICGSRIIVDVLVDDEGRVRAIGQDVQACALGQASASLMGAHVIGRTAGEIGEAKERLSRYLAGSRPDPGEWPGLAIFAAARNYPARHASILLAFEAAAEAAALASAELSRP